MTLALNQHRLALATKFSVMIIGIIAFYFQDLTLVFSNALSDESSYHILAIPFLFGYLLYRKRSMIKASFSKQKQNRSFFPRNFTLFTGILLFATAILVYWFGSYTFTPLEYHMLTLPILTAGIIMLLFNGQTLKQLAFPVAFLIFLTPPPTDILYSVGSTLSDLSAHASNALANVFGLATTISAQYGSPVITLTRPNHTIMTFSVDVACSGVYSLIGFAIFAVFIAYITRGKLWTKVGILLLGIPLIIALNIIRITTILGIGYSFGDQLALQIFHAVGAIVLMFIGTLILLATTEKFVKKPKLAEPCIACDLNKPGLRKEEFCPKCGKLHLFPKIKLNNIDITKIASIAIIIIILLSIQAPVFALTKGPAEVIVQTLSGVQPNTQILPLPQVQGFNLSFVYRDSNFEQLSGEDASLVYAYASTNTSRQTIWVAVELASTIGPLHRWETCLVSYPTSQGLQPSITQLDLSDVQTHTNPPIVGRYFAFQYHTSNQTQVVLYWYQTAIFTINGTSYEKQAKISLVVYPKSPSDIPRIEGSLLSVAKGINDFWVPIKSWTLVSLYMSKNGLALSTFSTALLFALLIYDIYLNRNSKASLPKLYGKLPKQNQLIVKAVANAQKQNNPTMEDIANELEKLTNSPTDLASFKEKLQDVENLGVIEKILVNREDRAAFVWRNSLNKSIF